MAKTAAKMRDRGMFARAPNRLLWDASLSPQSKLLLLLIISQANPIKHGEYAVFTSNRLLAEAMGCSTRHVVRLIDGLEQVSVGFNGEWRPPLLFRRHDDACQIFEGMAREIVLNWRELGLEDPVALQERMFER